MTVTIHFSAHCLYSYCWHKKFFNIFVRAEDRTFKEDKSEFFLLCVLRVLTWLYNFFFPVKKNSIIRHCERGSNHDL
jgi:hypothetical protein